MNLGTWLADNIITEESKIKTVIAIYPGRFQPMGKHHTQTFNWLQKKFGNANTFIVTSDKTEPKKSPFNFIEKKGIINKHGIKNVVQVKNPYQATELLSKYDPESTAAVFMVGEKDARRLGGKFFRPWKGSAEVGYKDGAYTLIAPHVSLKIPKFGEMSGTTLRQALASGNQNLFKQIMGWYDPKIYKLITSKLSKKNETIERFLASINIKEYLAEASYTLPSGEQMVDDGPRYFYGNQATYKFKTNEMANALGFSVLNYIVPDKQFEVFNTNFPKGPPLAVSYFPVGIPGGEDAGTDYLGKDLSSSDAYKTWARYIKNVAERVGYKFLNFLGAEESGKVKSLSESIIIEDVPQDVLDSFDVHNELNPNIWNKDNTIKPDIRKKLLEIAIDFYNVLDLPESVKIQDITLTGSVANYNWSKFSDVDLHLRIQFTDVDDDIEFVKNYFLAKKSLWNQKHNVNIYGFPVEVYVENIGDTHISSGLYSILNDVWINIPEKNEIVIDKDDIKSKAEGYIANLNFLETLFKKGKYQDVIDMVDNIKLRLRNMRQSGLETGAEYGVENLAFKVLRRSGYIGKINDIQTLAYDTMSSLTDGVLMKEWWQNIFEDIKVPVNIGDTVLMGRFKNKKVVVKSITKNEKGDYLINGRPAFKFRLLPKQEPANEVYVSKALQQALNRTPMKTRYQIVDPTGESLVMMSPYQLKTSSTLRNLLKYFTSEKRLGVTAEAPDEYFVVDLKTNKIVDGWKWIESGKGYKNIKIPKNLTEGLITEGGAAGHMQHPFDDRDLTFGELKQLIKLSLEGKLDIEKSVTEKTDGQNFQITWKDGHLGGARNKGTIKNPMGLQQLKDMFAKHPPNIRDAFTFAMEDLENAIGTLPENVKDDIFQNGKRFMNMEVIYPDSKNVITYGPAAYIQFHGLDEFDENANKVASYPEYGTKLQKMIAKVNADVQKHFAIIPPKILTLRQVPDFEIKESQFIKRVNKLQKQFKLKDSDEIVMYHQRWWENFINNNFSHATPEVKEGLLRRWAYNDKSFRLNKKTIPDLTILQDAINFDKTNWTKQNKENIYNFEKIFLELGTEVLYNISDYLSVVPEDAVQDIRNSVAKTIKTIETSKNINDLEKLKHHLNRIDDLGGFEKIVPFEGIVFIYKGKTYKLTGLFAPINQLLGLTKFVR